MTIDKATIWKEAYEAEHALRMAVERRLELAESELATRPAQAPDTQKLSGAVERACLRYAFNRDDLLRENRKIASQLAAAGASDHEIITQIEVGATWE